MLLTVYRYGAAELLLLPDGLHGESEGEDITISVEISNAEIGSVAPDLVQVHLDGHHLGDVPFDASRLEIQQITDHAIGVYFI